MLAIGRWKRYFGFYADGAGETFATYSIYTNDVTNEESRPAGEDQASEPAVR
jgi:hypothetical protein